MNKKTLLTTTLAFLLVSFFISCSSHSESSGFTSRLDTVDVYISQNETREAFKELKKLEKKAYSSYERLGIYKRYKILGEEKLCEEVLVRGLKKLPQNPELSAVYSVFLLRKNRLEEAAKVSLCLRETSYASINSECILRLALLPDISADEVFAGQKLKKAKKSRKSKNQHEEKINDRNFIFYDHRFIPVYRNAWRGGAGGSWLINAAVISLSEGDRDSAVSMYDSSFETSREGFFWTLVFYDAGLYEDSLNCIDKALFLKCENSLKSRLLVFKSDCLYLCGNKEESQSVRDIILLDDFLKHGSNLYVNTALYYREKADVLNEYYYLVYAVSLFPEYEPALGAYGQFAISVLKRPPEDEVLQKLRSMGLKTIQMEKNDSIPVVTVEDALMRIKKAKEKNETPLLVVTEQKLNDALNSVKTKERVQELGMQSESRLWLMLEHNSAEGIIPEEIERYALSRFVELGQTEKARNLFETKIKGHGEGLWQKEYEAWFFALDENILESEKLYKELSEKSNDRNLKINSLVNLGVIYDGLDRSEEALAVLNAAGAICHEPDVKAEILYRMADITYGLGDSKSALRSLRYALSLNPDHKKANLLLKKVDF